jgi:hypothetical protein
VTRAASFSACTERAFNHKLPRTIQIEREELSAGLREMKRDIKLKDLIIASFIPAAYQEKIMRHAHWDEYEDTWTIDAMPITGNALRAQRDLAIAQKAHLEAHYSAVQGVFTVEHAHKMLQKSTVVPPNLKNLT